MMAGEKRPSTSNTAAVLEAMVRLVTLVRSGGDGMATWRVSELTSQWIPRGVCSSWVSGRRVGEVSRRWSGMRALTSGELDLHLRRSIPACARRSHNSFLRWCASSTPPAPERKSST